MSREILMQIYRSNLKTWKKIQITHTVHEISTIEITIYVRIGWVPAGNNEFWEGFLLFQVFCRDFFDI